MKRSFQHIRSLRQFDGKYYKINIDQLNKHLVIIQGINQKEGACFIQYAFEGDTKSAYLSFPLSSLKQLTDGIAIAKNRFTLEHIHLELPNFSLTARFISPLTDQTENIQTMGFLTHIPFVQCKHEITTLTKDCEVSINYFDKLNLISTGKIYIERNWGKSFPEEYMWIHCCDEVDGIHIEFQFAAARPNFLGFKPKVHLGVLRVNQVMFHFGIQKNTKLIDLTHDSANKAVSFSLKNKKFKLDCSINQGALTEFLAPSADGMNGKICESLNAKLNLIFNHSTSNFNLISSNASAELINVEGLF